MNKRFLALAMLSMPLAISNAWADDTASSPTVQISGFGTAAMTWANTDDAQYTRYNQASGAGKNGRTGVDSNLGLQANVGVNEWLSGTVQGLVRKDGQDDYGAELAWAFAKAKISDNFSVRAGRMGIPAFMISDYRNVGYANNFLRPPNELYSQMSFSYIDGADATYQRAVGDTNYTVQFAVGSSTQIAPVNTSTQAHLKAKGMTALNLVAEHGPLTLRFGRVDAKISLSDFSSLNTLLGGLRTASAAVPSLSALADAIEVKDKKASFTSVGAGLDWNNVVAQAEYAKRKTDSYLFDSTSWYVMGGYRIGKFLPYYIHADLKNDGSVTNTVPAVAALSTLSAGVNSLTKGASQSTDTIGMRWDFAKSAALKVQIDRVKPKNGNGLLTNVQPGFDGGPVTVGAAAIDFVF
jgi:hypothetical protein